MVNTLSLFNELNILIMIYIFYIGQLDREFKWLRLLTKMLKTLIQINQVYVSCIKMYFS